MTSRCQGLFPPHPFFKGKALGTRLQLLIISKRSIALLVSVNDPDTLNNANSDYSVETLLRTADERMSTLLSFLTS